MNIKKERTIRDTRLYKSLTQYDACAIAEGFDGEEHTREELQAAWQYLVDTGAAWHLQGWYGRAGTILPPNKEQRDYYGNVVPAAAH